jgi:pimeloyl-ACP methyl ester carboxylesterase
VTLNYHRVGAGPTLVLLHGIGHHWQAWQPVIPLLATSFDVIACDSPGFGRSAPLPPGVEPTVSAYTDAFTSFFGELGVERPHVAGNSMGGAIALELGCRGVVGSVTAFSPAGFWTPAERRFAQISLSPLTGMPRPLRPAFRALAASPAGRGVLFKQLFAWPGRMPAAEAVSALDDAWDAPGFEPALVGFDGYEFRGGDELHGRGVPVTIAWGRYDHLLIYARQAPRARERLPWARHVTLGAGHVPFFDDPAAVAETVRLTVGAASAAGATQRVPGSAAGVGD